MRCRSPDHHSFFPPPFSPYRKLENDKAQIFSPFFFFFSSKNTIKKKRKERTVKTQYAAPLCFSKTKTGFGETCHRFTCFYIYGQWNYSERRSSVGSHGDVSSGEKMGGARRRCTKNGDETRLRTDVRLT